MAEQFFAAALFIATVMFIATVVALLDEFCRPASRQKRGRFVPWLEWLGKLILPSASPYYYWDPTSGDNVDANVYVGGQIEYVNWDLGTMGSHTHPASLPSSSGADTIFFDGSSGINGHGQEYNGNQPCNVDVNLTGNVQLQNGYNSQITIGDGCELDMYGYQDNDIPADEFFVNFAGPNSINNYDTGSATPGNIDYGTGGKVNIINGGALNLGIGANLSQSSGSPINVTQGQINFGDAKNSGNYSTFDLTTASADINIQAKGSMTIYQTGTKLIDNSNNGSVISNNGTATLQGVNGTFTSPTNIYVPFQNHSTLNVAGGMWQFMNKDASGNNLSMDAGSINLNLILQR